MAQNQNYQGIIAIVPPFEYCEIEDILEEAEILAKNATLIITIVILFLILRLLKFIVPYSPYNNLCSGFTNIHAPVQRLTSLTKQGQAPVLSAGYYKMNAYRQAGCLSVYP